MKGEDYYVYHQFLEHEKLQEETEIKQFVLKDFPNWKWKISEEVSSYLEYSDRFEKLYNRIDDLSIDPDEMISYSGMNHIINEMDCIDKDFKYLKNCFELT